MSNFRKCLALLVTLLVAGWSGPAARGAEVAATAVLSSSTASVGEAVRLEITVSGARKVKPPEVALEGVAVQFNGSQSRIEMTTQTGFSSSMVIFYTLVPQREGKFTIPAITIDTGGRPAATQPLTLTVSGQQQALPPPGRPRRPTAQPQPDEPLELDRIAFAEWVLPKAAGYVGETIPAELRVYLASNVTWSLPQIPVVGGDGFVIQKFPRQPKVSDVTRDGQPFKLVVFKTAVTAAKAGKLTLAPAEITTVARLPRRHARPRMQGFDDFFNDPFFNQAMMVEQEVPIRSAPLELEIKPLPAEGKPKGFSGAVGKFTFETKASPLRVNVGDPITVTAEVSGFGSFDRMGPPVVEEAAGWKAYPPSSKFNPDDDAAISGTKVFEMAVIADRPQTALPKIEFSYFDPTLEQYVTLAGSPIEVKVEGSAAPAPTPVLAASGTAAATPEKPGAGDIQFIRLDSGKGGLSFEPVWKQRLFWFAQAIPLLALLLLAGWRIRQRREGDTEARRAAALRGQKQEALRRLRAEAGPGAFYEAAVRCLQFETALHARGPQAEREPAALDAEAVCASRRVEPETAAEIRAIFAAHDELHYAGAGGGAKEESISPDRRQVVLRTLEQFERSHA